MNERLLAGMRDAMSLLQQQGAVAATEKIQNTLWNLMPAAGTGRAAVPEPVPGPVPAPPGAPEPVRGALGLLPDLLARLGVSAPRDDARPPVPLADPAAADDAPAPGRFLAGSFTNEAGTRAYKVYVPTAWRGQPLPLVVMLHGGGQTPDDFAAGTRFNAIAEAEPALVLYPAQAPTANATRCWNWFNPVNQQRDQGEPSIIAGMTLAVMATYHCDPTRVYCTGMSAGGAMAVTLGVTYPEIYAAVGAHSGMPYAAATDFASGFAAMNGTAAPVPKGAPTGGLNGVPVIVFHGDRDETVHPCNGDRIITQSLPDAATTEIRHGRVGTGHAYTQKVHAGPDGRVLAEQWLVQGGGHAWSGGSRRGSFTDAQGPDASREMMRFFSAQARPTA